MLFKSAKELLLKQSEEREELSEKQFKERRQAGTELIKNTAKELKELGQEDLLEQEIIEVEKIVKIEMPTTITYEDLMNLDPPSEKELNAIINTLKDNVSKEQEKNKEYTKEIDELKEQVKSDNEDLSKLTKNNNNLVNKNDELAKENMVLANKNNELIKENKSLKDVIARLEAKISIMNTAEFKMPVRKDVIEEPKEKRYVPADITEDLKLFTNSDTTMFGQYKGVIFEASKRMNAITVYDPSKYSMKDEIENALKNSNLFDQARDVRDNDRLETESGTCHMIEKDKYMGFIMYKGEAFCYVYEKRYKNGICVPLKNRISNPNAKYAPTNDEQQSIINSLVNKHENRNKNRLDEISKEQFESLGLDCLNDIEDFDTNIPTNNTTATNTIVNNIPVLNLNINKSNQEVAVTEAEENKELDIADMIADFTNKFKNVQE